MKKFKKYLGFAGLFALLAPAMSSCSSEPIDVYVHVLNAEDYIDKSLLDDFKNYVKEEDNLVVEVVYETYDTNETMYNTLKTGKQSYDAVCCSDYMIQRLVREDLAVSFSKGYEKGYLDNYATYVSPYLHTFGDNKNGILNKIPVEVPNDKTNSHNLDEYALGYMWGTLGIQFNPEAIVKKNGHLIRQKEGLADKTDEELKEYVIELFNSEDGWSALWDPAFKGLTSIKDSMRDSYAVGILETYKDYFLEGSDNYIEDYEKRNEKFNSSKDADMKLVEQKLIELKDNIFGFEVDNGKDDIVKGTVSANTAWSGDVVNSIQRGFYSDEDFSVERPDSEKVALYYAIPEVGGNVWFDAWCLPKHEDAYYESNEYKYALKFLDFLSNPVNAVANMSYNGYTSFIGATGSGVQKDELAILNYILDLCDLSDGYLDTEEYDEYDISYYFNFVDQEGKPLQRLEFDTFPVYEEEEEETPEGEAEGEAAEPEAETPEAESEEEPEAEPEGVAEAPEAEESAEGEDEEFASRHYVFEADETGQLKIIIKTDLNELEGRILTAQFPDQQLLDKLYVMRDFGEQNFKMVDMWESVKVNPLPLAVIIILSAFLIGVLGYFAVYSLIKKHKVNKRKKLREETK